MKTIDDIWALLAPEGEYKRRRGACERLWGDVDLFVGKEQYQLTLRRVHYIFVWFYREAKKRKKYDFLEKFFTSEGTLK